MEGALFCFISKFYCEEPFFYLIYKAVTTPYTKKYNYR